MSFINVLIEANWGQNALIRGKVSLTGQTVIPSLLEQQNLFLTQALLRFQPVNQSKHWSVRINKYSLHWHRFPSL